MKTMLVLFLVTTWVWAMAMAHTCPVGCICTKDMIRCLNLQMETVPRLPSDIHVLDLRFNKLKMLPPGSFSNLRELSSLLLNNNYLISLENGVFEGVKNLIHLYLFKNRIHHIESDVFKNLPKLMHLYIHDNQLSVLDKELFSDLPLLERLFLQNNRIERLPATIFNNLQHMKRLRLDGNLFICDCSILWLSKLIGEKTVNDKILYASAFCENPEKMKGISLNSIQPENLNCEKPHIKRGPNDIEVNHKASAMFTCVVGGDPMPEVMWMKNSNEIPLSDPRYSILENGSLKIDKPNENDIGVFECMAKSLLGESKSNTARMVLYKDIVTNGPPEFSVIPQSKSMRITDEFLSLDCSPNGIPQPYITWYHNNKKILLSEKVKLHRNGTISIYNLDYSDTGSYKCEAENIHGKNFATAIVTSYEPPTLLLFYEPDHYEYGGNIHIICEVSGSPKPIITWFKNGNTLTPSNKILIDRDRVRILSLDESDSGTYLCRGENSEGFKEESLSINLVEKLTAKIPQIIYKPYDIETFVGSKIELPCIVESSYVYTVTWKKDGSNLLKTTRHKISPKGSLYISNVMLDDGGRYECSVVNKYGRATGSGLVIIKEESIRRPGDQFVNLAFAEAVHEVDGAINKTVNALFNNNDVHLDIAELYRIIRFPSAPERQLAKASEIYERTLANVRRYVHSGINVTITTDFNYKHILSPDHIALIAKLSGCMAHRLNTNCTNSSFHNKYRSIDGTCNNLENPTWGASNTGFRRILKPIYENGFNLPVGWTKGLLYNGYQLPSARSVSSKLITTSTVTPDSHITHMVMQWGQFLDHDLDHATPSVSSQSWGGIDCKRSCEYDAPCFPIEISRNDYRITNRRCIDFIRSSSICGSGMTSVFFENIQPREQINQLTSFIDASQVYGYAENIAQDLRNLGTDEGLLREGVIYPGKKALLPFSSSAQEMDCRRGALESDIKCFIAGDIRANEQVGLLAMHTLWFREHNRIATKLKIINPHWNGDTIYHEARKIVGAEMQYITYHHWLPIIIGPSGIDKLNTYQYNPSLNPSISNVFATAALRFGHSLINPVLERLDEAYEEIPEGHLPLHKAFFASWRVAEEGGIDPLLRGLYMTPAKLKTPTQNLNSDLTEKLFHVAHAVALDLAAINIQRSRDHALPSYTAWRKYCNMSTVESFEDLKQEIKDKGVRNKLKKIYGSVHNIDVWVGGILEDQVEGAKVGPLFQCLLIEQFSRLRDGDRFWYENSNVFKPSQLCEIKKASLSRVLCDNGDKIETITDNVFILPEKNYDKIVDCEDILEMDLYAWRDCDDCEHDVCLSSDNIDYEDNLNTVDIFSFRTDKEKFNNLENRVNFLEKRMPEILDKIDKMENRLDEVIN